MSRRAATEGKPSASPPGPPRSGGSESRLRYLAVVQDSPVAFAFRAHVVPWLPLKRAELSDQLDRASISAVLNVAEGAGRAGRDQARHYAIARGSAYECLAVLDLLELETRLAGTHEARTFLVRLMSVLTALIRR